jgi:hypothetical protein
MTRTRKGVPERRCGSCRHWWPDTAEHYRATRPTCRRCLSRMSRNYRERLKPPAKLPPPPPSPPDLSLGAIVASQLKA